jgi:AcrR family transcriptional regulator
MSAAGSGTRDRILEASLRLFNEQGLAAVSTHRIAAELGISPGNLHYHFKTKGLIVAWLFRRFEHRVTPCIDATSVAVALDDLWLSLHMTFEAVSEYRFIYRDVNHLLNEFPELESPIQALTARNATAAQALCAGLASAGVVDADAQELEMISLQIVFTATCWFTFKRLTPRGGAGARHSDAALAAYYTLTLLSPYVVGEARDYLNYLRAKYLR